LEETFIQLPPTDEYTYFEVEVDYFSLPEPDTVNIAFASSNLQDYNTYIGLGSALYLDALNITYKPNLVGMEKSETEISHQVYPNPSSDKIYIEFQEMLRNDITVKVMNVAGKLVYENKINPMARKQFDISVQNFAPGIYFYNIESKNDSYKGKFIVK